MADNDQHTPAKPPQQPRAGGSYEEQADGSVKKVAGTQPAEPELAPEPQTRD
jgi:hypothetical protein